MTWKRPVSRVRGASAGVGAPETHNANNRMAELWRRLGWDAPTPLPDGLSCGELAPGTPVAIGEPLFPRLHE